MVLKVFMLHANIELLPSDDSYEVYPVNNDPTEVITLVSVGIYVSNQLGGVDIAI